MAKQPDSGWKTVTEGAATKVGFDTLGDVFIGTLLGQVHIAPENDDPFDVWQFRAADGQEGLTDNELVNINTSYGLRDLESVPIGSLVRLEYVKDVPTNKGNPMKSFLIQYKA